VLDVSRAITILRTLIKDGNEELLKRDLPSHIPNILLAFYEYVQSMLLRPFSPLLSFVGSLKLDIDLKTLGGDIPAPFVSFKANDFTPKVVWKHPIYINRALPGSVVRRSDVSWPIRIRRGRRRS
jgi:hypothetical protein